MEGILLHSLVVALTVQNDVGDVYFMSQRSRDRPAEQPQQVVPPGLGGSDGGGLGATPG